MTYTGFETAAGALLTDVSMLNRHLTLSGSFGAQTHPTLEVVEQWINLSYSRIVGLLTKAGYSATQTNAQVLAILEQLNALDVSILIELAHPTTATGEANERFKTFMTMRKELEALVNSNAFADLGATAGSSATNIVTKASGISVADRETRAEDTDDIPNRFRRGQFRNPQSGSDPAVRDGS